MPKGKRKVKLADPIDGDETVQIVDLKEKLIEEQSAHPELCGHRNRHASGELTCILPKGHAGNHYNDSEWSDAAGIPVRKNG
jgi:hypothetical protein